METTYRYIENENVALDDGTDFTNAIMRRCRVSYSGGPVKIDGAKFPGSSLAYVGSGVHAKSVVEAYFRSLYAEGHRTFHIREDGKFDDV